MLLKNFLGHSNISNTFMHLKYSNKDIPEVWLRQIDIFRILLNKKVSLPDKINFTILNMEICI